MEARPFLRFHGDNPRTWAVAMQTYQRVTCHMSHITYHIIALNCISNSYHIKSYHIRIISKYHTHIPIISNHIHINVTVIIILNALDLYDPVNTLITGLHSSAVVTQPI